MMPITVSGTWEQHSSALGRIKIDNAQVPLRRDRNRLPRKDNHPCSCQTAKRENHQLPRENKIPKVQTGLTTLPWLSLFLQKLPSKGYAILNEDDPNQKCASVKKSFAPIAYGSKTLTPSQLKMSIYAKEFIAIYYAFKEFGHIFWGTPKLVIILTDNKSVTRFFQTNTIAPPLWNLSLSWGL